MKIQYCSDLHLEFTENQEFLQQNPIQSKGEVLILAGDIMPFALIRQHDDFFDFLAKNFEYTFWLPGNHEFYHSDISLTWGAIHEKVRDNVYLVNNISVSHEFENVHFIFSTLWTKINPVYQSYIQSNYSDFHVIKNKKRLYTPDDYNQLNKECIIFITDELNKTPKEKTIVVTHHVPTLYHYPEKYKNDAFNSAFAVDLTDLIEKSDIAYWVFGHHHQNIPAFKVGNTQMVNNQLGYVEYNEHWGFRTDALIEI